MIRTASIVLGSLFLSWAVLAVEPQPVEITLWTMEKLPGPLSEEIAVFEKQNPDIHVHFMGSAFYKGLEELRKMAEAGSGPDVLEVGSTWVPDLKKRGLLPDVTSWIEKMGGERTFTAEALRNAGIERNKRFYGIPWTHDVRFIVYRRDVFKQAGLSIEDISDLEDFAEACRKFDGFKDASGIRHPGLDSLLYGWHPLLWWFGTDVLDPNTPDGLWDEDAAEEGFEFWFRLLRSLAKNDAQGLQPGIQGAVLTFTGPWMIPKLDPTIYGIGPYPAGPDGAYTFSGGTVLALPRFAKERPACRRLVEFLVSRESQLRYCKASGSLPVRRDATSEFDQTNPFYQELRQMISEKHYVRDPPRFPQTVEMDDILWKHLHPLFSAPYEMSDEDLNRAIENKLRSARKEAERIRRPLFTHIRPKFSLGRERRTQQL